MSVKSDIGDKMDKALQFTIEWLKSYKATLEAMDCDTCRKHVEWLRNSSQAEHRALVPWVETILAKLTSQTA